MDKPSVRPVLRFSVEGLRARDELLFKSFVRLLSHRTLHEWSYTSNLDPFFEKDGYGLRVIGESVNRDFGVLKGHTLSLGSVEKKREAYLCMPLRSVDLEAALNKLGELILSSRQTIDSAEQTPNIQTICDGVIDRPVRLVRWPPADLLASPGRIRLAALMTGRPVTLADLQEHSGQSSEFCSTFLEDLKQNGLLGASQPKVIQPNAVITPVTGKKNISPTGLLARIRSRLGLQPGRPS